MEVLELRQRWILRQQNERPRRSLSRMRNPGCNNTKVEKDSVPDNWRALFAEDMSWDVFIADDVKDSSLLAADGDISSLAATELADKPQALDGDVSSPPAPELPDKP